MPSRSQRRTFKAADWKFVAVNIASTPAGANAHRRNVSTGQKAMAVADDLAAQGKRKNGRWARGSISQESDLSRDVWRVAMAQAGLVIDWRPDLTDDVIGGEVTLNAAAEQADWHDPGVGTTAGDARGI